MQIKHAAHLLKQLIISHGQERHMDALKCLVSNAIEIPSPEEITK
jgi:hypothetical protein